MASPNYYAGVKDASAQPYEPGLPSTIAGNDVQSLQAELQRLSTTTSTVGPLLPQVATKAPENPVNGMIRYAKAPWNPMGLGDGWVQYVNGAWINWPSEILGNLDIAGALNVTGATSLSSLTTTGSVSIGTTLSVTGTSSFTGAMAVGNNITVSRTGADAQVFINTDTARTRRIMYTNNGLNRIGIGVGAAGEDFALTTWDDTGALIGTAINVSRLTRQTAVPSGTVTEPMVTFIGDTDTGIYRPGVDQWAVTTAGVQRLIVSSAGITVTGAATATSSPTAAGHLTRKDYVDAGDRWVVIGDTALTSVAQVEFTWTDGTYRAVRALILGAQSASGGASVNLLVQFRQGASTWLSGATDIFNQGPYWAGGAGAVQNFQASVAVVTAGGQAGTPEPISGVIDVDPGTSSQRGGITTNIRWLNNGSNRATGIMSAQVLPTGTGGISGLRFSWETGVNFAAVGRILVMGIKA